MHDSESRDSWHNMVLDHDMRNPDLYMYIWIAVPAVHDWGFIIDRTGMVTRRRSHTSHHHHHHRHDDRSINLTTQRNSTMEFEEDAA